MIVPIGRPWYPLPSPPTRPPRAGPSGPALAICSPCPKPGLMFCGHHRRMRNKYSLLLLVSIAALATACSSGPSATTSVPPGAGSTVIASGTGPSQSGPGRLSGGATQTSDAAGVTIAVTWAGPSAGAVFEVQMDNHMIDLGSVDLTKATLTNDRGERLSSPASQ